MLAAFAISLACDGIAVMILTPFAKLLILSGGMFTPVDALLMMIPIFLLGIPSPFRSMGMVTLVIHLLMEKMELITMSVTKMMKSAMG